jgi:CIC family chloride channel protein
VLRPSTLDHRTTSPRLLPNPSPQKVGGLFQPSLFLGALVGDIAGHVVGSRWGVVDPTTFTVVGAAAVLGAACRAPLTAVALMVEITR